MASIKTVSKAVNREITLDLPDVLKVKTLAELVAIEGEDLVLAQAQAQLTVSFRAMVRTKLESTDDNDEAKYDDTTLEAEDFSDWKPTIRVRQSDQEKAVKALANCEEDELADIIAKAQAAIAAKALAKEEAGE